MKIVAYPIEWFAKIIAGAGGMQSEKAQALCFNYLYAAINFPLA